LRPTRNRVLKMKKQIIYLATITFVLFCCAIFTVNGQTTQENREIQRLQREVQQAQSQQQLLQTQINTCQSQIRLIQGNSSYSAQQKQQMIQQQQSSIQTYQNLITTHQNIEKQRQQEIQRIYLKELERQVVELEKEDATEGAKARKQFEQYRSDLQRYQQQQNWQNLQNSLNNLSNTINNTFNQCQKNNAYHRQSTSSSTTNQNPSNDPNREGCGANHWRVYSDSYNANYHRLLDMQKGYKEYNDNERKRHQSDMKRTREEWNARGCSLKIDKDPIEDWDGKR